MPSVPFLSPEHVDEKNICLICCCQISRRQKSRSLNADGWDRFTELANKWSEIAVPDGDDWFNFTKVRNKVKDKSNPFGRVHNRCRINFRNKHALYAEKYGLNEATELDNVEIGAAEVPESVSAPVPIIPRGSLATKRLCFICGSIRDVDDNLYNEGGLGHYSHDHAKDRLLEKMNMYLSDPYHRQYLAAERFRVLLSSPSSDVYSKDVYYHRSCYLAYTHPKKLGDHEEESEIQKDVLAAFFYKVKVKIIREKCAYLMNELLEDVTILSEENGLQESVISNTTSLKRKLIEIFGEDISFFPKEKFLLVHASDMNPCEYSIATLHGYGLRDDDLARSFGKMIKRKVQRKKKSTLARDAKSVEDMMDEGPLPELYNAIFYSLYDDRPSKNTTSLHTKAVKIWSLASDWESLIT